MKKLKRLLLQMVLASLMMGFSVEGGEPPAGTEPPPPGTDPPAGDPPPNGDPPPGDPAAEAAAVEAARVAALSPEQKAAEEAAAATKAAEKLEAEKLIGAPEAYAPFTAPEGSKIPEGMEPALTTLGKKFNLSQEGTQELLNHFSTEIEPILQADREKAWQSVRDGWKGQLAADPELGGADHAAKMQVADRAFNTFLPEAARAVLNEYGLTDHPEFKRLMYKVGTSIREDTFVAAGNGTTAESKLAGLYPTMNK